MRFWEMFFIAVGLSMDAFAAAICKGLAVDRVKPGQQLAVGLYFGGFQALMPLLGYLLGARLQGMIARVDHWIAFVLLAFIGLNMIREAREKVRETEASFSPKAMIPLAVATSIDALAAGVTFAFLQVHIIPAVAFIGSVTFLLSAAGLLVGNAFGSRYKAGAEICGGAVLILMGLKILLEHLGLFPWK